MLGSGTVVMADGSVEGNCYIEKVKDQPGNGNIDLYEWNIWLSRNANAVPGQQFRVGLPPNPQGYYEFLAPSGNYSLILDQPVFWGRPKIVENVTIPLSGATNINVWQATDYSCGFSEIEGFPAWGTDPWTVWHHTWYQTFVATGTSINCISFKLAGTEATQIEVSIHRDVGGNVVGWPTIGPPRRIDGIGPKKDNWARFRSGELPTIPGQRYALKLRGVQGGLSSSYAVFRRLEDGQGYAQGQAHDHAGNPMESDLYAFILSDNDHTVVPYCLRTPGGGTLAGWSDRWSQEIEATANGLAGCVLNYAGVGDFGWNYPIQFKVRTGGPNGTQIGPAKTSRGAFLAANAGFCGVSWNRGEVPLTIGEHYWIEATLDGGFNPAKFTMVENVYQPGDAYNQGVRQQGVDLLMQVVEYVDLEPVTIERTPAIIEKSTPRRTLPVNDTITVRNGGGHQLRYTISEDADWLFMTPTEGTSTGEVDIIELVYHTRELAVGNHRATIEIADPLATNSPQFVEVDLTITAPVIAVADLDGDGDVDQTDFGKFQACYTSPGVQTTPACIVARLDGDEDVDVDDFGVFQRCFSGPDITADPNCGN